MNSIYETDKLVAEYLLFHYGSAEEILSPQQAWPAGMHEALDFPIRTISHFSTSEATTGLDLGCAVGRSTFEMAHHCQHVTGIDFSHAFIQAAEALRDGGTLAYDRLDEGSRSSRLHARRPDGIDPSRVRFTQGDAMNLPGDLGSFDRVHAANLLCRLGDPKRLLDRLPDLVNSGGELVLATPCTWLTEFTPPQHWPAGDTLEWLISSLSPSFELIRRCDEPFLIRETARKFQWSLSLVTRWKRRP